MLNLCMPSFLLNSPILRVGIFIAIHLFFSVNLMASDPQEDFKKAGVYYQKQDYENAAKSYEDMVKSGNVAAEVYYNLGNCYFKTGNLSHAMLNYERAQRLAPDDDDINFNLKIASLRLVDKMDAVPEIFYKRWLKLIASAFSIDAWSKLFLSCVWLLFFFFALYLVAPSASMKKFGFIFAMLFIVITGSVFAIAQKSYAMTFLDQHAIITATSVYVKSSPDEKGSDQFIIHEGTKVDVLDELGDWKKVRIANGSIGWLKHNEIEII